MCLSPLTLPPCHTPHSRNARLSPEARQQALSIYQALQWAQQATSEGAVTDAAEVATEVSWRIKNAGGKIDYVEVSTD